MRCAADGQKQSDGIITPWIEVRNILNPLLLIRTLGYLRWEQLAYRPLRLAQYRLYRRFPVLATQRNGIFRVTAPVSSQALNTIRQTLAGAFAHICTPLDEYDQQLSDLQNSRFTFLNRSLTLAPLDWNRRYGSHLWNYQLHYFNFAVWCARAWVEGRDPRPWQTCQKLMESWMENARVGQSDGWDAYPLSLRVVNWIYCYALVADRASEDFLARFRTSLFQQVEFLHRHLEHHLLANHLLKNIKALVIGGLFFENKDWLSEGEYLFWREFEEQVLPDGGHYERSPMYHAQALGDFLECYALLVAFGRIPRSENIEAKLRAMAGFLEAMRYPNGRIALFNDSANAEEMRPDPLLETARRVAGWTAEFSQLEFPQSGYYIWQSANRREKMIVDAGAPSVEYNTAHAHCDLLSYELWLDGRPLVVDSGVHGYGGDRFREYCRSTRGHNTVMFDDREQSEVWSTFRMARRARAVNAEARGDAASWNFRGSFARYDGGVTHERRIHRGEDGVWTVADIARQGEVTVASSFIHLHPDVEASKIGRTAILCCYDNRQVWIEPFADEGVAINACLVSGSEAPVQGWHFPDFGIAQPSVTIQFTYQIGRGDAFGYRIKAASNL